MTPSAHPEQPRPQAEPSKDADTAAQQFRQRQAWLRQQVRDGKLPAAEADARLLPWLHIAALAGADLPELRETGTILFPKAQAGHPVGLRLSASDLAHLASSSRQAIGQTSESPPPQGEALAELARARDAAIDAFEEHPTAPAAAQARALTALANALGAPPYLPQPQRKAA